MNKLIIAVAFSLLASSAAFAQQALQFKTIKVEKKKKIRCKVRDYAAESEDGEEVIKYGKATTSFTAHTLYAEKGEPRVRAFINQYLTLDAAGKDLSGSVTADSVSRLYGTLEMIDIKKILQSKAQAFLEDSDANDDLKFSFATADETSSHVAVEMNTPTLLTLNFSGWDYPAGAAHGMSYNFCTTFDLKNLRQLSITDIVAEEEMADATELLHEALRAVAEENMITNADADFSENCALTSEGFLCTYGLYEIAPYSSGIINIVIPYDKILPHLTPEVKELLGK